MTELSRRPLAFGMQEWGPLPGTAATLFWGGPGDGLYFVTGGHHKRIVHPSASGTYDTVKAAGKAAQAFAAAGTTKEASR